MDQEARLQEWQRKLVALRQDVHDHPDNRNSRYELGKWYYIGGMNDKALKWLRPLARDRYLKPVVNLYICRIYERMGKYRLAIRRLYKALDDAPMVSIRQEIGHHLVRCLLKVGEVDEAKRLKGTLGL